MIDHQRLEYFMITKKLLRRQARWENSYQNLTLLSFIPQVEKIKKQTYLLVNQMIA